MNIILSVLGPALALSFAGNLLLLWKYQALRQALIAAKKAPHPTLDVEQLLHDLTRGPAVLRVEVVDAKNLLLRSPRG